MGGWHGAAKDGTCALDLAPKCKRRRLSLLLASKTGHFEADSQRIWLK